MDEMLEMAMLEMDESIDKCINRMISEFGSIRAGRANPHILDKIFIDYYGSMTPLQQTANINVADARCLVISPWDASMIKAITSAISEANLGVGIGDDGRVVRLSFPILTEERRKALVKEVKVLLENCNIAIRSARRDAMDALKNMKKDGMGEDEYDRNSKKVQKVTDDNIAKAAVIADKKMAEVMEV